MAVEGELPAPTQAETLRREITAAIHDLRNPTDEQATVITVGAHQANLKTADHPEKALGVKS